MGEELSTGSNSDLVASWVHESDGSIEGSMWQIERYLTAAHDQAAGRVGCLTDKSLAC